VALYGNGGRAAYAGLARPGETYPERAPLRAQAGYPEAVQDMLPDPEIRARSRELLAWAVSARTPTGSLHPQINMS
jgi:hypothetical protein